jgi:hypothetical protein
MIVTASPSADVAQLQRALIEKGLWVRRLTTHGGGPTLLQVEAYSAHLSGADLLLVPGVQSVSAAPSDHPLVDKQAQVVHVGGVAIGVGAASVFMAGPCSVESEEQIHRLAAQLAAMRINPAPRHTRFRDKARWRCAGCMKPRPKTACWWSPSSWAQRKQLSSLSTQI